MGASAVPQSTVASQPALQWVSTLTGPAILASGLGDQFRAMPADGGVLLDILVRDQGRLGVGGSGAAGWRRCCAGG